MYRVAQKRKLSYFDLIFAKCWPNFTIFSPVNSKKFPTVWGKMRNLMGDFFNSHCTYKFTVSFVAILIHCSIALGLKPGFPHILPIICCFVVLSVRLLSWISYTGWFCFFFSLILCLVSFSRHCCLSVSFESDVMSVPVCILYDLCGLCDFAFDIDCDINWHRTEVKLYRLLWTMYLCPWYCTGIAVGRGASWYASVFDFCLYI